MELDRGTAPTPGRWAVRPLPALGLALALLFALYWPTVTLLTQTWSGSETFKHGWLVAPISLWLVWQARNRVPMASARPWWPALLGIAMGGATWLVGDVAGVASLQELGLVLMVQFTVMCVLGPVVARSIAFPLVFLFFAIPVGEFLIPSLMRWTADFTVFALRASGIPVLREGNTFVIPSGTWSVVEACSGVRYLIASLTVGTLYAYLTYRSNLRRALFIVAAIVVPIVANWLRAYFIVMLGHYSGNALAVGVDHLVYGWIFFGLVIALMFWVGSYWREDDPAPPSPVTAVSSQEPTSLAVPGWRSCWAAAVTAVVMAATWPALAHGIDAQDEAGAVALDLPAEVNGWRRVPVNAREWAPAFLGATSSRRLVFEKEGARVGLYVGYFRQQRQGRELVSSNNVLVSTSSDETRETPLPDLPLRWQGGGVAARSSEILLPGETLVVARWYWIDDALTASDYEAKARQAVARLLFRGDDGAGVVVWTARGEDAEAASATLRGFVQDAGPSIQQALVRARGTRT